MTETITRTKMPTIKDCLTYAIVHAKFNENVPIFFHISQLDKCRLLFITSKLNVGKAKYQFMQLTLFAFSSIIDLKIYDDRRKPVNSHLMRPIFQLLVKNGYFCNVQLFQVYYQKILIYYEYVHRICQCLSHTFNK